MDKETRNRIQHATQAARRLLEDEYREYEETHAQEGSDQPRPPLDVRKHHLSFFAGVWVHVERGAGTRACVKSAGTTRQR